MTLITGYTFGQKTTTQIDALTGMVQGDTVYNTDYHMIEWYTGDTWQNDHTIELTVNETCIEGNTMFIELVTGNVEKMTNVASSYAQGIGVVHYGATISNKASIFIMGVARTLFNATVDNSDYAIASATAGVSKKTTVSGYGVFGQVLEPATYTATDILVPVLLTMIERAG
jgi:hypothetical protein